MGTQLRQWTIRLLAAVSLPIMLTLGLGAAANAQPMLASHVSSTEHPSTHHDWEVYGPFDSLRGCLRAQREFRGRDSHCEEQYRYHHHHRDYVWYLYVHYHRR